MKTQGELITDVRERLDESSAHQWSEQEIRRWINDAARDIARKCETLLDTDTISAVVGTQSYTMPTDVVRVHRVEWKATGDDQIYPLEYRDYNNADAVWWNAKGITQNTPFMYTMWGFPPTLSLIVYPIPAVAGTFTIYYYRLPTERAIATNADANATIEIPEGWHDVVCDYVEFKALRKDKDPSWREAKEIYDEHVMDLHATTRRWSDQAGMITPSGVAIPAWLYGGE